MSVLFWRGVTTQRRFQERFADLVRMTFPQAQVSTGAELEIIVTGLSDSKQHTIWLGRAYQEFQTSPKDVEEILRRYMGVLLDSDREGSVHDEVMELVPMLKDLAWVEQQRSFAESNGADMDLWTMPYNVDLLVVFAVIGSGIRFLSKSDLHASGRSAEELQLIALQNLRRRTPERTIIGGDGRYLIGVGGNLEASLLLDDQLWLDTRLKVRGTPVVGIPDRDSFAVTGSDDLDEILELSAMTVHLHRTERYPISDKLFIRKGDRFERLDPNPVDENHPIPNLDVIDVHGSLKGKGSTLVIVIASPIRCDARSVYRLYIKLDGYVRYIQSPAYEAECGRPNPSTTTIQVRIHPNSDRRISDLIVSLRDWTRRAGASLDLAPLGGS